MKKQHIALALLLAGASGASHAAEEIRYLLWDAAQKPAYQACAAAFEQANPDLKVKVVQKGWGDYWTELTTGFIAGTAPDVFTNHLSRYPEFVANGQLLDLAPLIARDKLATDVYYPGLYEAWSRGDQQYGLPKDWDTIALVYNKAMLKDAGVTPEELRELNWNPRDGGSFGTMIARLSRDEAGHDGLSPDFDPKKVKVRGFQTSGAGGMSGQTEWSHFAVSNGFRYYDGPWSRHFNYADPKLAETLSWLAELSKKGYSAPLSDVSKLGASALFAAGKVAMVPDGAWMVGWYKDNARFEVGYTLLPAGPQGRATMFNGLADSIWSGSKHKEAAWKWVRFLGSSDCQSIVARSGVVFPAIRDLTETTLEARRAKGIDASAFVEMTQAKTFLPPIADRASQINTVVLSAIENVLLGKAEAQPALSAANAKVNEIAAK